MSIFKARYVWVVYIESKQTSVSQALLLFLSRVKEFEEIFAQDVIDLKQIRQQAFNGKLMYIFNNIIIDIYI